MNDTPTTPHAPVTEEIRALCMKLSMERAYDPDGTDCQTLADYVAACIEQTRLNGCEAVRRSEEAANSDRQMLAAVTQGLRTEFQEGDTWDETDLLENWEVFFAHHKAVEAKLAAETARADANASLYQKQFQDACAAITEHDTLAAQVAMFRDALKEVRDDHNFGHLRESACDLVYKAIAAIDAATK